MGLSHALSPRPPARLLPLAGITLVLAAAALARFYHITLQSLWFDEAFAWNIVRQADMFPRIAADTHPPLYYLLLRGWVAAAGDSPLALRALSALTSTLTVALVYRFGREMLRTWRPPTVLYAGVPLMAAVLMALTDAEIDLAQETRSYALYTALACASMVAYLRWQRGTDHQRGTALLAGVWIAANTALVYTHYQGAFIPAIQGLHALIFLRGRQRLGAVAALAASGLLFAPWLLLVTLPQAQRAIALGTPFAIPSNLETLLHLRREFLGQMWSLVLALMALGGWTLLRTPPGGQSRRTAGLAALVVGWLVIPFGVLFFGNYFAELLTERKLALVTPAIALLAAVGLARLRPPATALVLLALVIYSAAYVDSYRLKEPWDAVAADAAQYARPGDLALIEMGNGQYPMLYYWMHTLPDGVTISTFPVLGDPTLAPTTDWFTYYDGLLPQQIAAAIADDPDAVTTAWLGFWSKETASIQRLEQAGFVRTMTTTHDHLGNALDLYRYDRLPAEPRAAFDGGLTLRAVEIDADALRVDLWWSAEQSPAFEYVTSALLLDANGALAAQMDSVPFLGARSTLTWQPGEVVYDPKTLHPSASGAALPPGDYRVLVQVYRFDTSGGIVQSHTQAGDPWIDVGTIQR